MKPEYHYHPRLLNGIIFNILEVQGDGLNLNQIINGDCLTALQAFPSDFVDSILTSPPYFALRSYLPKDHPDKSKEIGSEKTLDEYLKKILEITAELKRVLKPEGSFWLNMGDCYGGTGSKGNYRDPKYPNGRNGQEVSLTQGMNPKSMLGVPWRIALKMMDEQGWILRSDVKWIKQIYLHKEKRTIGSVLPTSATDRFNQAGEYLFHFTKNRKYYFDLDSVRIPIQTSENRPMGIDREKGYSNSKRNQFKFNYRVRDAEKKNEQCPQFKATNEEKDSYKKEVILKRGNHSGYFDKDGTPRFSEKGKNLPNAWLIGIEPSKDLHFAKFPSALCEIPILTTCPKDGIVLDPFFGSGTTGLVARKLLRNYIGIELNSEYIKIAQRRLNNIPARLDKYVLNSDAAQHHITNEVFYNEPKIEEAL